MVRHPDENHAAVYRWLLERNARMYGVAFAVDQLGDIYLVGRLPLHAVTPTEVDRLLGAVLEYADASFDTILELGLRVARSASEWDWRVARGESTRNLDAFQAPAGRSDPVGCAAMSHDVVHLILLRHGESEWNAKNLFTGWVDVDLTDKGEAEARSAAASCCATRGLLPDVVHTSVLRRAIRTANIALDVADRHWIPVRAVLAAERAALRRACRARTRSRPSRSSARSSSCSGAARTTSRRRRSTTTTSSAQAGDPRYAGLPPELPPATECLKDVVERMLPYWYDAIVPDLRAGKTVLVAAHGNSLRALVKHLDGISRRDHRRPEHPDRHPAATTARRGLAPDSRPAASTSTPPPPKKPSKPSRTRAADLFWRESPQVLELVPKLGMLRDRLRVLLQELE